MRLQGSLGTARRLVAFVALLAALAVVAGAATIGRASTTNGTVSAAITSVLNDQGTLVLGSPTPGKNIGYTYSFTNTGSSTINHLVFSVFISDSSTGSPTVGAVKYFTVSDASVSCTAGASLSCTDSQLVSGGTFTMTVIFSTDPNATAADQIFPFFTGTYSPESLNQTNNRNNQTKQFSADNSGSIRNYADPNSKTLAQSLTLPTDPLNVGNAGQFSAVVTMPPGFLNNNKFVGVTVQTLSGQTPPALCTTCTGFKLVTTIPLAPTFSTSGPFNTANSSDPYSWTMTIPGALLPSSFKPFGVWHTDNAGQNGQYLPTCAFDGSGNPIAPTGLPGLCVTSITQDKKTKDVTYTGIGVNNGTNWGG